MSVAIRYVGSSGNSYNLKTEDGLRIKEADFHNYAWDISDVTNLRYGDRLNRFKKASVTYTATLWFTGNLDTRKAKIEALHRDFETDIINQTAGKIYWGSDYIECYIISSDTAPDEDGYATTNEITIYCPYPFWIEEVNLHCAANSEAGVVIGTDKGYDANRYGYSYSYAASTTVSQLLVDHYAPSTFKLIAYGPTTEVLVTIAGHIYKVNYPLLKNEYMVLDTRPNIKADRRLYVHKDTEEINIFDYRDTENSLFTKIPAGDIMVNYSRAYPIDLTVYIERSEPRQK